MAHIVPKQAAKRRRSWSGSGWWQRLCNLATTQRGENMVKGSGFRDFVYLPWKPHRTTVYLLGVYIISKNIRRCSVTR